MEKRIRRLGIFMVLCFVALFIQLNNIQVIKATSLADAPNNPHELAVSRDRPRGDILSADGVVLASSVPSTGTTDKYRRVYNPYTATLFSQIVGYDSPIYGHTTGIEGEYNKFLESHTRPATSLRDWLVNRTTTDNVTLTINTQLQNQVAAALEKVDANGTAPDAGAVVLNVKTGAVEAMDSVQTFDPNNLVSPNATVERFYWASLKPNTGALSPLVSRAFQYGFMPGSTFKAVTSSAVYDHDPALANVNYPVTDCILVNGRVTPLCNYQQADGSHERCGGTIQVTLPQSCNTAFAQMGIALGPNLATEAQAFGFNQQIPLDLPGVSSSLFPTTADLTGDDPLKATAAFGQGFGKNAAGKSTTVVATALQMAVVAAGIANRGVIMTPHVMQQIRDTQGNLVKTYTPTKWLAATNPLTAAAVTQLMQGVVNDPGGTAGGVGFPASWNVAAKTGTAETGTGNVTGSNLTNDWMIAFAPANDPKVAVAVMVPNQPGSQTGASTSGPPMLTILGAALAATP
jgi:peptidoglycan glycosyltransferase